MGKENEQAYADLNKAWKSTCTVLLGEEIGDISGYKKYLQKYTYLPLEKESFISGRKVIVCAEDFAQNAKFISNDEREEYAKRIASSRLNINDIKDIDSIVSALREQFAYAGSITLGNSFGVQDSTRCTNASYVYGCVDVCDSKYVGFSSMVRYSEYMFGCNTPAESKFCIKSFIGYKTVRCMEAMLTHSSSDCYFTGNMEGCMNCMFSFNQRGKSNLIGNVQLAREEYAKLRAKLAGEIRDTLKGRKTIPTIIDIIGDYHAQFARTINPSRLEPSKPPAPVEKTFSEVSGILLGKQLSNISTYRGWLQRHVPEVEKVQSIASVKPVTVGAWLFFAPMKGSYVTFDEAWEIGKKQLSKSELSELSLSNASKILMKIKTITPVTVLGQNIGNVDSPVSISSSNCYFGTSYVFNKCCAYCMWPRNSEYCIGSKLVFSSQFCLKCYHSESLSRCFEVSDSYSCTDCYFCHNCENVRDSMFCFNAKNLQYAIGNIVVGQERYAAAKKMLLEKMQAQLAQKKEVSLDIYNLGGAGKK